MAFAIDITGHLFGYLTAIEFAYKLNSRHYWLCKCRCGVEKAVNKGKLMNGESKSCGCYAKERTSEVRRIHLMSKTRFYGIWNDMIMRCYNPKREGYHNYGGRGIKVEKRWRKFDNFKNDMFDGYKKGLSLERVNVNGNYCRKNCKWIPLEDQKLNRRNSIKISYLSKSYTVSDFAKEYNLNLRTFYDQIKNGFTIEKVLNKKLKKQYKLNLNKQHTQ